MSREAVVLQRALVAVYRPYVRRVTQRLGVEVDQQAVDAGEAWLAHALQELLSRPYSDQPRGPLEVFQESLRFVGDSLAAAGVPAPTRDEGTIRALPGDRYDLAPPSTRELGRTVWEAHLRWGAAKASALSEGT